MDLYEYQAKDIFDAHGVPVLTGIVCTTAKEAREAAETIGEFPVVVKAQVKIGGRGKAGGVKLAWSADDKGSEAFTIRVRDVAEIQDIGDSIAETTGGIVWTEDSSAFYYTRIDAQHRPTWVMRHRLGTPVTDDVLVFESTDPAYFLSVDSTLSRRFAVISLDNHATS